MVELYWESHLGIALDGVGDGSEDDHDDGELHPRIGSRAQVRCSLWSNGITLELGMEVLN